LDCGNGIARHVALLPLTTIQKIMKKMTILQCAANGIIFGLMASLKGPWFGILFGCGAFIASLLFVKIVEKQYKRQ